MIPFESFTASSKKDIKNAQKFLQCEKNIVIANLMLLLFVVGFETVLVLDLHKIVESLLAGTFFNSLLNMLVCHMNHIHLLEARPCTIIRHVIVLIVIYFYQVNHTFSESKCSPINFFLLFFNFLYVQTIFVLKNKVHIK